MPRLWLHALMLLSLGAAAAASAQTPPPADPGAPRGPYVGDETHRPPIDGDIPFPEGVTPRDRPLVFAAPRARAGRGRAAHGRHAAAGRRHGAAKHTAHHRRRR